ncbi:MAG: P-type conjugative transfer protein TrbJ [Proteobacteria bacterium]|nr:P-type conjugative transfer protein TrbJ [Pseudomonadota bacterium]
MKKIAVSVLVLAAMLAASGPAFAQWVVFDPSNFIQNMLTELHTLTQIENQVLELQNEAQMLLNQAKNLQGLNFSALTQLQATYAATEQLLSQAQGLTFDLNVTRTQLAQLYPAAYGAAVTPTQLDAGSLSRWTGSLDALDTAIEVQAQATQNLPSDESVLSGVLTRSTSAVGSLQAIQATNQLLGLRVRQVMQSQQLAITQDRAVALEEARIVESEARARALRSRFMTSSTPYTPEPIDLSGN